MAVFARLAISLGLLLFEDVRFAFFGKDTSPERIPFELFASPIVWAEVGALLQDSFISADEIVFTLFLATRIAGHLNIIINWEVRFERWIDIHLAWLSLACSISVATCLASLNLLEEACQQVDCRPY
ncbi:hypothetical protein [Xanthomonas hydrangeae]|uniref:hypothetical protein n=1 Tax=Xanthomonas hydrangeae TaxID=2775159 RepID=UPI001E539B92